MRYAEIYLMCSLCTAFGYCMNAVLRGTKNEIETIRQTLKR